MRLLTRVTVSPLHAQVEITDREARHFPQWGTGRERVVASSQCIAVATRDDRHGPVTIEAWEGALGSVDKDSERVFDGEFVVTSDEAEVGNSISNELTPVRLNRGIHRVQVYVSPAGALAERVYFVVDADVDGNSGGS